MSEEELAAARRLLLPVAAVDKGGDVARLLEERSVFGAIGLEALLVPALQIGAVSTLRLIGPASVVPPSHAERPTPFTGARLLAPVATRLVLLGDELLAGPAVAVARVQSAWADARGPRSPGLAAGDLPAAAGGGSGHGRDAAVAGGLGTRDTSWDQTPALASHEMPGRAAERGVRR